MSDKPTATNGGYFAVPGWSAVLLRGEHATAFAQAQFMGDLSPLAPGHWQWNGWLTPKGRLIALFALAALDERTLAVLLADVAPDAFVAALSRFRFRSRVEIAHEPDWRIDGCFGAPDSARGARFAGDDPGTGLELDFSAAGGPRTLRVSTHGAPADAGQADRWRIQDLAHGLPRLDAGQAEQWTPQQLSLDRLRAYSVHKGCYPGQEIVARTHFLGQARRGLVRLGAAAGIPAGDVFAADAPDRAVGRITSSAGVEALAVLPVDAGEGPFLVGGMECRRLPLLDGLAR